MPSSFDFSFLRTASALKLMTSRRNKQDCGRADDVLEGFPSFHCFLSPLVFGHY
jgi:hypothetical protein